MYICNAKLELLCSCQQKNLWLFKNPIRGGKAKQSVKSKSRSSWAGLQFPVGRLHRKLKKDHFSEHVGASAPVYLAAVLEYLTTEVLELASNAARDNKKCRIIPRHLQLAIIIDDECFTEYLAHSFAEETH